VAAPSPSPPEPDWRASVEVTEDRELGRELVARYARARGARAVSVTDLVDLRRGYWRRNGPPVEMPPERRAAVEAGRALHLGVGRALAGEGALEVRLRRDGISGRIDLLADVPVEMKTGPTSVDPAELRELRPEQVEQLAIYCSLLDRPVGRLLYLVTSEGAIEGIRAVDVAFADPSGRAAEISSRVAAFRAALEAGSAAALPRCRWFDRGCQFRSAGVCDCRGDETPIGPAILRAAERFDPRPDVEGRVRDALARSPLPASPPSIERFRDLIYPRRAFFEQTAPARPEEPLPTPPSSGTPDVYLRLVEAVESGPPGEVRSLPSLADEPAEEVGAFRDEPYLVRTSRAWDPVPAERLLERSPQYALDLGFRAAVTGALRGRVVLAYDRAERDEDRIVVYELRFSSLTPFSRLWRQRADALRAALRSGSPLGLLPCPAWMYADCPYRGACACASEPGRSQR
jgi:hypothetical protein